MTGKQDYRKGDRHLPREGDRHRHPNKDRHFYPSRAGRFVGVDGEGYGKTYALLADSGAHSIIRPHGISSIEVFDWLSYLPQRNGKAVFLGFALNYDVNHWLADLPDGCLYRLWKTGRVRWGDWWMEWAPHRWFHLKHLPSGRTVRIYDVFPFFQGSFLKACQDWGVAVPPEVVAGKAARREFTAADLPAIETYNRSELTSLVILVGKLKDGLYAAGINLNQWYGAGAVATWLMCHNEGKSKVTETPPEVRAAALSAYFGGRIEAGKTGHFNGPITNWDVRSAYPDAMRKLPNLANGTWRRIENLPTPPLVWAGPFAVYRIEWKFPHGAPYYPLPWRSPSEAIYFPGVGRGWYWRPEAEAAMLTAQHLGGRVSFLDGWEFVPNDSSERAFPWVAPLFDERKRVGTKTGAGKAVKLGMNALYGKLAQKSGVFGRIPTYRQYEYAGWITSFVRAKLWMMTWGIWDRVISYATDGIYLDGGLPKTLDSERLGDWERTDYAEMDIALAGVYRVRKDGEDWERFSRGYGKTGIPWEEILRGWADGADRLTVPTTHFHTLGECIHLRKGLPRIDRDRWRSWTDEAKEIRLRDGSLKRAGDLPFDPQYGAPKDSTPYHGRRDAEEMGDPPSAIVTPSRETEDAVLPPSGSEAAAVE